MDEIGDHNADLVKSIEEVSAHFSNKANKIKYNGTLEGSRESNPYSHMRYIKIRNLNEKYRKMYDKFIQVHQTMNERSRKYKNVPYTPKDLEELEKNGYVSIFSQYMGDIEMISAVTVDHIFTCHSCLYNGDDDIILFDVWNLDQNQYPNTKSYREYDIIVYDGKTGFIDHTKSMHAINNQFKFNDLNLDRLKLALSLFKEGFCKADTNDHFLQCPMTLGGKTTNKPNLIDSYY